MKVHDILATKGSDVYAVNHTAKLREAITMLNEKNVGVVLVTDDNGKLAGILSERDIVRKSLRMETGFRDQPVTETMTSKVFTVTPEMSIEEVAEIMSTNRFRHIPVMEGDDIAGLISLGDVVKRQIETAEKEAAILREYIAS